MNITEMTREDFKMLFKLDDFDEGMFLAEEDHEKGKSWFQIAQESIEQMNSMLCNL